jgi:hypothetical protein
MHTIRDPRLLTRPALFAAENGTIEQDDIKAESTHVSNGALCAIAGQRRPDKRFRGMGRGGSGAVFAGACAPDLSGTMVAS